jgi:hypothetical protein
VVKANGDLGGFAYDISLKIKRLQAEGVSVKNGKIVNFQNICLYSSSFSHPFPQVGFTAPPFPTHFHK